MFKELLITTRFGNLLIIGLLQYMAFQLLGMSYVPDIALVIASTVLIAFAGYVVNDMFDQEIDKKNRPGKNLFEKAFYQKHGIKLYVIANIIALAIATVFSVQLLLLYIGCVALLYAYAAFFKGQPVLGNVLVACMQAAVFLAVWLSIQSQGQYFELFKVVVGPAELQFFWLMLGFSFLTGWIREWIKDMEDREGDAAGLLHTAALVFSERTNRLLIAGLCLVLSIAVGLITLALHLDTWTVFRDVLNYYYLFLMFPICVRAFLMVLKAKDQKDWSKLSQWLKVIMLAGVLSLGIA